MVSSDDDGSKIHDLSPSKQAGELGKVGNLANMNQIVHEVQKGVSETVPPTDTAGLFDVSEPAAENGLSSSNETPLIESMASSLPFIVSEDAMDSPATVEVMNPHHEILPAAASNDGHKEENSYSQRVPLASGTADLQLPLLSLPIDSLHCIASFLTPIEWSAFGRSNRASSRVYREVSRRVRMHGFRCATEVVTAWKLGQQADAKELTALYIHNGVPIYPYSLGHSYHTLVWRMAIEAREMQAATDQKEGGDESSTKSSRSRVDRFYTERPALRAHEEYNQRMTYLEEKCLFVINQEDSLGLSGRSGEHRRASPAAARVVPDQVLLPAGPPFRGEPVVGMPVRAPPLRQADLFLGLSGSLQTPLKIPESRRPRVPKPTVKIHQHLLDQHLLSKTSVNDQDGAMRTAPVSLSADFFHPFFARKSASPPSPNPFFVRQSPKFAASSEAESTWDPALAVGYAGFPEDADGAIISNTRASKQPYPADGGFNFDELDQDREINMRSNHSPPEPLPPPLTPESPTRSVLEDVELEAYSASTAGPKWKTEVGDGVSEIKSHLRTRFAAYQRRLESLLAHNDSSGFEECILDFWDEFLPLTANIQFYDRHTAVPRISGLHKFLTKPCPKAIGIVQCEIERIKINSKKKGVTMKGRFFPVYEYRLFIRHRPANAAGETGETGEPSPTRRDTVLIAAKNRGRKHLDASGVVPISSSAKKGVNNYFLYMPQQADVDAHFNSVNAIVDPEKNIPNGASHDPVADGGSVLLGRLQSNIIGTEFQIFTPSICKRPARKTATQSNNSVISSDDEDVGYDSGMSSDNASATSRRRSRFSRRTTTRRGNASAGEQPSPIEEEISSADRRIKRTGSWPVLSYSRSSRTSRRAIANTSGAPDTQQYQTILCEEEDGAITYTANLLGNRPRIMDVCIPRVSIDGVAGAEWKRYLESCDDASDAVGGNRMLHRFKQLQQRLENPEQNAPNEEANAANEEGYTPPDDFGLLALQNRPPWWNIDLGAFVLNFGGRVSVASVKNFQLCDRTDHDNIMLQFGRIHGRHSFTMDFKYPLTAVQAFAIAISSLQSKISFG